MSPPCPAWHRYRVRLTLTDGRSSSRAFSTWDEADGAARAALEVLGADSGATTAIEEVDQAEAPEGLLSAAQAAARLGVSLSTFKDHIRAELPTVRVGRRVLFDGKDLDAWQREHKAAGPSESPRARGGPSISSASVTLANASSSPRAKAILARLRSKQRASTRTP